MLAYLETLPEIGVLGPKMLMPNGSVGVSVNRLPTVWNSLCCALGLHLLFPKSKLLGGFEMNAYSYDKIDEVEVLTGWFWMIPRKALSQVGGLDERFFMYGEDIDWCQRFIKAGWRVVFYPHAEALHYCAGSSSTAPARFYVEMRRANLQYFRKHHGLVGVLGYRAAILIHETVRIAGYSLLFCFNRPKRIEAVAKVRNSLASMRWLAGGKTPLQTGTARTIGGQ
jgi:GT2 family glycosyltransferase